jgi:hypothetical protein
MPAGPGIDKAVTDFVAPSPGETYHHPTLGRIRFERELSDEPGGKTMLEFTNLETGELIVAAESDLVGLEPHD